MAEFGTGFGGLLPDDDPNRPTLPVRWVDPRKNWVTVPQSGRIPGASAAGAFDPVAYREANNVFSNMVDDLGNYGPAAAVAGGGGRYQSMINRVPTTGVFSKLRFPKTGLRFAGRAGLAGIGGEYLGGLIEGEGTNDTWRDVLGDVVRGGALGSVAGPWGILGGAALGLGTGLADMFNLPGFGWMDPKKDDTDELIALMSQLPAGRSEADWVREGYERGLYDVGPAPTQSNAAAEANAREAQMLADYWSGLRQYGVNRAQALNELYGGLSAAMARTGEGMERRGTNLAAEIEALYSGYADDLAALAAGQAAGGGATAGLAPASGAMATAPVEADAAGATLSSYLQRGTGAQAQNMYDIAGVAARQGAAVQQSFLDMLYTAERQAMADAQSRAIARSASSQAAFDAEMRAYNEARRQANQAYQRDQLLAEQAGLAKFDPVAYLVMEQIAESGDTPADKLRLLLEAYNRGQLTAEDVNMFAGTLTAGLGG
jgi:hypothetical protein